ncbi:MAG: hypothetical protein AAF570_24265, partial [Bacteroidota bacterium]
MKALPNKERRKIFAVLSGHDSKGDLARLFAAMEQVSVFNQAAISKQSGIAENRIKRQIHKLSKALFSILGQNSGVLDLENAVLVADRFADELLEEEAEAVIRSAMKQAKAQERFEVLLRLFRISHKLNRQVPTKLISEMAAFELQENLNQYRSLFFEWRAKTKQEQSAEQLQNTVLDLLERPALQSLDRAKSVRAKCYFLKIRAALLALKSDYVGALAAQEQLIQLFKSDKTVAESTEICFIRNFATYVNLLMLNGQTQKAERLIFQSGELSHRSKREELLLIDSIYLLRLVLSARKGDTVRGDAAQEVMIAAIAQLDSNGITKNLAKEYFFLAHYSFTKGDFKTSREFVRIACAHKPSNFPPLFYPMLKLIDIFALYEIEAYEGAIRAANDFKRKNHATKETWAASMYLKTAIDLVEKLANAPILSR